MVRRSWWHRAVAPLAVWCGCALVYFSVCVGSLGVVAFEPTVDNHYAHLAASWWAGSLELVGATPPGTNDWACYDSLTNTACPMGLLGRPNPDPQRYHWHVSFPPLPALLLLPLVAVWGVAIPDRLVWAVYAGVAPALLFLLLRFLREQGFSRRTRRDDWLLTGLFAFGTVYFFCAVFVSNQGSVFYAAHVVASALVPLFLLWSWRARHPVWAGATLGLAFMTRPPILLLGTFFVVQAVAAARGPASVALPLLEEPSWWSRLRVFLEPVRWRLVLRQLAWFALPLLVVGGIAMGFNAARFDDPFEFGHQYLEVAWRDRIAKWGLFNYHYVAKNLAVFSSSLPWLSRVAPHLTIPGHGLALWFTTPCLLWVLWPKRTGIAVVALVLAVIPVWVMDLMYQNSGWVQFGYRFALDYMVPLFALLALGGRRFGSGFCIAAAFALIVNAFGAVSFDRAGAFYHVESPDGDLFQPD